MRYVVGKEEYFVAFRKQNGLKPLEKRAWLSSPTMHGPELQYMTEAFESNWMSTVGENIGVVESLITQRIGCGYAVALCSGTAALHLAVKLAGVKSGDRVFVSDMTFSATANAIMYEGGEPVFIDADRDTWNMDPAALERAFELYPAVKTVVIANLYGTPGKMTELCEIAHRHGALLLVDMAHIAGLVAGGQHESPVPYADVVTTTTHKTLRGPRGGVILAKEEWGRRIDSAVFPGMQGGPLLHVIAGKAVCFREAMEPAFRDYARRTVENAAALAEAMLAKGFDLVSGGTDNHLMLVDLRSHGITGRDLQERLDGLHITLNKNAIPGDPEKPAVTSGVRMGTPCVTTRGFDAADMEVIAQCIHRACRNETADRAFILEAVAELTGRHTTKK